MYKVRYVINGIVKEMSVNAKNGFEAQQLITNMYGNGAIQIIDIRRI